MNDIKIGILIAPQFGDMSLMRDRWMECEDLGADVVYTCDHFFPMTFASEAATGTPCKQPDGKNFEATTIQAAMAATTSRVEIGCIVHANSYRNPNLMADIARTIDHISGGRFILGMGSGYQQRDYEEYGYEFGTTASRLHDLDRDLPIIKARFEKLNPKPLRKIPLMVASMGEKIGMRIVAKHADMWQVYGPKDIIIHKTNVLRTICDEVGRDMREIELTTMHLPDYVGEGENDPNLYPELGIRHIVALTQGPEFNLGGLKELLAWRKAVTSR